MRVRKSISAVDVRVGIVNFLDVAHRFKKATSHGLAEMLPSAARAYI